MQSKAIRLPINLEDWCRSGRDDLIELDKKLKAQKTSLRLEVLNLFKIGKVHFGYFDKVLARLQELNDSFTNKDWNTVSDGRNFFYTACSSEAFTAVMNYKVWVGRAAELKELWEGVDDRLRNGTVVFNATGYRSYENNYSRHYTQDKDEYRVPYKTQAANSYLAASRLEGEKFTLSENSTKEDLFTTNELGTTPLDDPRTWEEIDKIMKFFRKKGTPVTKADFLRTNTAGTTYFERAEHFAAARAVRVGLRAQGEKLVLADIADPNFKKKFEWNMLEFSSRAQYRATELLQTLMVDPDHLVSSAGSYCLGHLLDEGAYPVNGNNLANAALNGDYTKVTYIFRALQSIHRNEPEAILEILTTEHNVSTRAESSIFKESLSYTANALKAAEHCANIIATGNDGGLMSHSLMELYKKAIENLKKKLAPANWVGKLKELQEFAERVKRFVPDFDFEKAFRETFELTYSEVSSSEDLFSSTTERRSPLEFSYGWEALARTPQIPITKENLSSTTIDGEPFYYKAIKLGAIDELFSILRRANIRLVPEELRYQGSAGTTIGLLGKRKACHLPLEGLNPRTQLMLLHESGISNDQIVSTLDIICGIQSTR